MLFRFLDKMLTRISISSAKKILGKESKAVRKLWKKYDLITGKQISQFEAEIVEIGRQWAEFKKTTMFLKLTLKTSWNILKTDWCISKTDWLIWKHIP